MTDKRMPHGSGIALGVVIGLVIWMVIISAAVAQPLSASETVTVRTVSEMTSKTVKTGDIVQFSVDGCETCTASGMVILSEKPRNRAKDGRIVIEVREVDGKPASGILSVKGRSMFNDVMATGLLGTFGLFVKGVHAKIPAETAIEVTK